MGEVDRGQLFSERRSGRREEAELHRVGGVGGRLALVLEARQQRLGPRDHGRGQAGQSRHLDAVRAVGAARLHLVEEHDLVVPLAHRHVEVAHPAQPAGELRQLVEVRREQHLGTCVARRAMEGFDDGPGDGQAVERRRSAPDFVEQHEAA